MTNQFLKVIYYELNFVRYLSFENIQLPLSIILYGKKDI